MRECGILLHISSLPAEYGIGTMGKAAYDFVDFLKASGQSLWQVLPIGPISFGDSPYQSPSTYAGNPYFIDFDLLAQEGLLKDSDYKCYDWGKDSAKVDYEAIYINRFKVLRIAYNNGFKKDFKKVRLFIEKNSYWLEDYSLFMAIKGQFQMKSYTTWDMDIRLRKPEAVKRYRELLQDDINFHIYIQYLFYLQWMKLKDYANKNNIRFIGDIPIYVAQDSVDTWANPELFMLDAERVPILVAGCPPDAFTDDGQLWGNPIYNWHEMKEDNFRWWINRIKATGEMFDVVRIDHFRGFASYYAIKNGAKNARVGHWMDAPGIELFDKVKEELPSIDIIAEDLGFITEDVHELMNIVGFPGMKILLFAFGAEGDSEFIPYKVNENSVAYIGTHDNDTFMGWLENAEEDEKLLAKSYMNLTKEEGYNWGIIRTLYGSKAKITMVQMQDILGLDNSARMNLPGTVGDNWQWRVSREACTEELSGKLYNYAKMFGRLGKHKDCKI
jgi:4-alpha-glucanotransferase